MGGKAGSGRASGGYGAGALCLCAAIAATVSGATGAFELDVHERVTRAALVPGIVLQPQTLTDVVSANLWSDSHQASPHRHFDNAEGPATLCVRWLTGIDTWLDEAMALIEPYDAEKRFFKDRPGALERIGWVTHSIQDFFAHSNYVELGLPPPAPGFMLSSCRPEAIDPRLQTGFFDPYWGTGGCPPPGPPPPFGRCHLQLNKDGPDRPHHASAVSFATLATAHVWEEVRRRIIEKYGGDDTVDAECMIMKLAWNGDRPCHRKWVIEGTVSQSWLDPTGFGKPVGDVVIERVRIRLQWLPTRYRPPPAVVVAPVQIEIDVAGPLRALLTWPRGCDAGRADISYGETVRGDLPVVPDARAIKPALGPQEDYSVHSASTESVDLECPRSIVRRFKLHLDPICLLDNSMTISLEAGPRVIDFHCGETEHRYRLEGIVRLDGMPDR